MRNSLLTVLFSLLYCSLAVALPQTARMPKDPQFKVGLIYPRTGPLAAYGQSLSEGVRFGLQKFREENPQVGSRIGVIVADDGGLSSQAEKAADRLISVQKVHIIIGSISNVINQSIGAVTSKNSTLLLLPQGTDESLLSDSNTFSLTPSDRRQGEMLSRFTLRQLRRTKAVIISDSSAPDSEMIAKGFAEAFPKGGGQVLGQWLFEAGKTEPRTLVEEVAKTAPEVIAFPGSYRTVLPLIEAAKSIGLKAVWLGGDGWDHPSLLKGRTDLGSHYFFSYFHKDDPHESVQSFVADFEAFAGHKPDLIAAHGYEAIRAVLQAYTMTRSSDHSALAKALEGAHFAGIYGAGHFAPDRVYLRPAPFMIAAGGQLRFLGRVELEE